MNTRTVRDKMHRIYLHMQDEIERTQKLQMQLVRLISLAEDMDEKGGELALITTANTMNGISGQFKLLSDDLKDVAYQLSRSKAVKKSLAEASDE